MKRHRGTGGFTLIELLIVIIIIGILAAIAIPMFLGQRDKAKEAAVKEGIHSIQIGVQSYAVDYNDTYPTGTLSNGATSLGPYVDNWPKNPWGPAADTLMAQTSGKGNFSYEITSTGFRLIGFGKSGAGVITVP